jgi:hypothetical protein
MNCPIALALTLLAGSLLLVSVGLMVEGTSLGTLDEEKEADQTLTSLAGEINAEAEGQPAESEKTSTKTKSKRVA